MSNTSTEACNQYQNGIEFKRRIDYYNTVDENYRYFQGDQWGDTQSEGLPTPVFNVIKPVIRYKVSTIMQNDTRILFSSANNTDKDFPYLTQVSELLSEYSNVLWEKLKMDFHNENLLQEGAITGNGFSYFYYDEEEDEITVEQVDGTNIYPANPNLSSIEDQKYIIIAFRRNVEDVRAEAREFGFRDVEMITPDTETAQIAGDSGKIEQEENEMCNVLLKLWKDPETGTVHYSKSTQACEYIKDEDLKLRRYPLAMFTWENRKNCFFGLSDVTGLIPNQDYINTIAAMIMASTTFTAFPKMVYNEDYIENPSNQVGVAIGVSGSNLPINDVIQYIAPRSTSSDVFNMFDRTIALTRELMGANDSALGNINPESASGKAILAVMEQSAMPLESVKRRFYNYLEDVALIWADIWRCTSTGSKPVTVRDAEGKSKVYYISAKAFKKLMLQTKIEIGPSTRWSEVALMRTLENLLTGQYINFEWYVNLLPENSGLPKARLLEMIEQAKTEQQAAQQQQMQMQMQQQAAQQPQQEQQQQTAAPSPEEAQQMIDQVLSGMDEATARQMLENPQMLQELFEKQLSGAGQAQ